MKNSSKRYRLLIQDTVAFLKEQDLIPALPIQSAMISGTKRTAPEPKKKMSVESSPKEQKLVQKQPVQPALPTSQEEYLRKMIARFVPDLTLRDFIPQKDEKSISGKRKACVILSFSLNEEELQFLKQLAKAIHAQLGDTKILDGKRFLQERKEKISSSQLQLFIALEKDVPFFEKNLVLSSDSKTLLSIPILLLASPLDYAQNPSVKRQLWMHISQHLQ